MWESSIAGSICSTVKRRCSGSRLWRLWRSEEMLLKKKEEEAITKGMEGVSYRHEDNLSCAINTNMQNTANNGWSASANSKQQHVPELLVACTEGLPRTSEQSRDTSVHTG